MHKLPECVKNVTLFKSCITHISLKVLTFVQHILISKNN
jgi:hypothetical protein